MRVSNDVTTNEILVSFSFVRQSQEICESASRHSYECRLVLFSHQIVGNRSRFLKTVAQLSHGIRTTFVRVARNFCIVNLPKFCGDRFATLARTTSCDVFWRKKMFKHV